MYKPTLDEFREKAKEGNLIPVYREILADLWTPVSAFNRFLDCEHAYLLESVERGEKLGRYSFLAAEPSIIFRSKGKEVEIERNGNREKRKCPDPLSALKSLMEEYRPVETEGLPRFYGGAVGYLSYDLVRFFEKLPDKGEDDLNLPDTFLLFTDTILIFDHIRNTIKVVCNAHLPDGGKVDKAYNEAAGKIDQLIKRLQTSTPEIPSSPRRRRVEMKSNLPKKDFLAMVKKAKEYIRAGDVIQVVLSQRFQTKIGCHPFQLYRALRSVNPSPYMYYLKCGDIQLVGSSPEIMVREERGKVEVRPIAGTRRRGKDENEDHRLSDELLSDPKERAEHIMLVDLGRNDVGRVADYGSVKITEFMAVEKYSHVMHIVSNVEGSLHRDKDQFDVLRACFPAGTVSGAPRVRAMEIIEELEPMKRGPYAGAIGYFGFSGNLDSCITIRTILVKDNVAYVQAGAGIVADSDPEREYEETVNKAKALAKAIEIAEGELQ